MANSKKKIEKKDIVPQFAFNIYYSESPDDGATYLHSTEEEAKKELVAVFEDIILNINDYGEEEGWKFCSSTLDKGKWFATIKFYDDNIGDYCTRILTVNKIYD